MKRNAPSKKNPAARQAPPLKAQNPSVRNKRMTAANAVAVTAAAAKMAQKPKAATSMKPKPRTGFKSTPIPLRPPALPQQPQRLRQQARRSAAP